MRIGSLNTSHQAAIFGLPGCTLGSSSSIHFFGHLCRGLAVVWAHLEIVVQPSGKTGAATEPKGQASHRDQPKKSAFARPSQRSPPPPVLMTASTSESSSVPNSPNSSSKSSRTLIPCGKRAVYPKSDFVVRTGTTGLIGLLQNSQSQHCQPNLSQHGNPTSRLTGQSAFSGPPASAPSQTVFSRSSLAGCFDTSAASHVAFAHENSRSTNRMVILGDGSTRQT